MSRDRDKRIEKNEFRGIRRKLMSRSILIMAIAVVVTFVLYKAVSGHIGIIATSFLNKFIFHDEYISYNFYDYYIRDNLGIILIITILIIFILMLSIYIRGFSKYFIEINRAIDSIMEEDDKSVSMSPELFGTENKINNIKHTLSQRKLLAEKAEQKKNDLVVYLAHDLKTPLTSVIGYLNLLENETEISPELRAKYIGISLEKAERLEDLINEFFEITRFNLSNISLNYSTINLTRLLEQTSFEFLPMLSEKGLKCNLEMAPDIMINCDADKLQRVFDNLLRNALNYSFPESSIDISGNVTDEKIALTFTNAGPTIPKDKLDRIFDQFCRLDNSRSSSSGGAGLGLAIAKEIVELHGGTIRCESADNKIKFIVNLPVSVGKS